MRFYCHIGCMCVVVGFGGGGGEAGCRFDIRPLYTLVWSRLTCWIVFQYLNFFRNNSVALISSKKNLIPLKKKTRK